MKKYILIISLFFMYNAFAQKINVYQAKSAKYPKLTWFRTGNDTLYREFSIYRANLKDKKYQKINTLQYLLTGKKDTVQYLVVDTTLTKRAMYQYFIKVKTAKGDSLTAPAMYAHNLGYVDPPRVVRMDATGQKDQKTIKITWQLNYNFSVRKLTLMRSSYHEKGYEKVAELPAEATGYTDFVPLSNHNYFYFLLIADFFGYQYPSVPVPSYTLYKTQAKSPQNLSLHQEGHRIKLTWQNVDKLLAGYRVFRSLNGGDFRPLHPMQTSNNLKESYVDNIPEGVTRAGYYVINYSDAYTPSQPSDTLSVFFQTVKPLAPPTAFDIIKTDENHIKFLWTLPQNQSVSGYRIYMESPRKKLLTTKDLPGNATWYDDMTTYKTGTYVFAIKSIDAKGNESAYALKNQVQITAPYIKLVADARKTSTGLRLEWKKLPDTNIKKISLYRQSNDKNRKLLKIFANKDTVYWDKNTRKGEAYLYSFEVETTSGEHLPVQSNLSVSF